MQVAGGGQEEGEGSLGFPRSAMEGTETKLADGQGRQRQEAWGQMAELCDRCAEGNWRWEMMLSQAVVVPPLASCHDQISRKRVATMRSFFWGGEEQLGGAACGS